MRYICLTLLLLSIVSGSGAQSLYPSVSASLSSPYSDTPVFVSPLKYASYPIVRYRIPGKFLPLTEFLPDNDAVPLHRIHAPDPHRLAVVGGVIGGVGFAVNEFMRNAWWSDQRGPFHYQEALIYARNLDKLGHVYAGYLASFIFYRMINWTGYSESRALWYGATLGLLFQTYVEIQDGFSTRWGFERYDVIGDFAGAALFVARYYVRPLQYFQMKFGYYPSDRLINRGFGDNRTAVESWIDDYEGHTYWIAFRAGNLANDFLNAPRWLRLVNIAAGWSLGDYREYTEFYLALDLNFEELPGSNWFLRRLWEGLDLIKFPSPGIRIRPGMVVYGLYF